MTSEYRSSKMGGKLQILILMALGCLAACRPRDHMARRSGQSKVKRTEACVTISDAFGEILNDLVVGIPFLTPELVTDMSTHLTGYDAFSDSDRELVLCSILSVSTTSELLEVLYLLDIPAHGFRVFYDNMALMMFYGPPSVNAIRDALYDAGMLSLDPEGVAWLKEMYEMFSSMPIGDDVEHVDVTNPSQNCRNIASALDQVINSEVSDYYSYYSGSSTSDEIQEWTGVDLSSERNIKKTVCPIVRAASRSGLVGVYNQVVDLGIPDNLLGNGYALLQGVINGALSYYGDQSDPSSYNYVYSYAYGPGGPQQELMLKLIAALELVAAEGFFELENDLPIGGVQP